MRNRIQIILATVGLVLLLVVLAAISRSSRQNQRPQATSSQNQLPQTTQRPAAPAVEHIPQTAPAFPASPLAKCEFVNTGPDASYVGSQACAECHESEFESYLRTTHSRALDDVDLAQEPPEGEFLHEVSGRKYRIHHKDGQMWHRESIPHESGELVLCDYPMRYVMGSGNHSRRYLVEENGFLMESPVTWYAARQAWGMSPGYQDNPLQQGFARPARFLCVNCHAGQVASLGGSIHRLRIHEQSIGCERCHGPGSLHVDRHRNSGELASGPDKTIVNPGRLSRERREAVCGQCHLATVAHSQVRGRSAAEYRPGLRLTDFIVHYQLETPNQAMSVVGHVEQLRLSKCYQQSEMDCTTCHHPHADAQTEQDAAASYRRTCLECHAEDGCGLSLVERQRQSETDNCIQCHMPTGPTDIPHFAFTHHRIGIHQETKEPAAEFAVGKLVPLDNIDHLSPVDQLRCVSLAYLTLAESEEGKPGAQLYHKRGLDSLYELHAQGLRDPEVEAALAWGFWRQNPRRCIEHAQTALASESLNPMARRDALSVLARTYFDTGQHQQAVATLEQLTGLQRDAEDWGLLGESLARLGKLNEAIKAARQAAAIEPDDPGLQKMLAMLHARLGQHEQAATHSKRAQITAALRARVGGDRATEK